MTIARLTPWQLAVLSKAVEALAPTLEPVSAEALVRLLRNATEVRVTYRKED